jgi:hydrogenase expression/formation protein HypC
MCLAIPGKIISITGSKAIVDFDGIRKEVVIALLPQIREGKFVIVHAGYAIQEIDENEAIESIKLWRTLVDEKLILKESGY